MCSKADVNSIADASEKKLEKRLEEMETRWHDQLEKSHTTIAGTVSDFGTDLKKIRQFMEESIDKKVKEAFSSELRNAVTEELIEEAGKFFLKYQRYIIATVLIGAGAWYSLYYQVQRNSEFIEDGGRYTQEEADRDNAAFTAALESQRRELNEKLDIIISQTKR